MIKSVKKKNILLVCIIVLALICSTIAGVLLAGTSRKGGAIEGLSEVAAFNFGNDIGNAPTQIAEGTPIYNETDLKSVLNSNGTGRLMNDVSINWGGSCGVAFSGKLYGNGYKITIEDNFDDWRDAVMIEGNIQAGQYKNHNSGMFVGRNDGTIQDVTFEYANKNYWVDNGDRNGVSWTAGVICGENKGTIKNVKVILDSVDVRFHTKGVSNNGQQKVVLGGAVGVQNGIFEKVHVEMKNGAKLNANAKAWASPTDKMSYTTCSVGGVIGVVNNGITTTTNISMRGDSSCDIITQCESDSWSGSKNGNNERFAGAVVGYSAKDVKGVICDYKGTFNTTAGYEISWPWDGIKTSGAISYCDVPQGYYSTGAKATMNANSSTPGFNYFSQHSIDSALKSQTEGGVNTTKVTLDEKFDGQIEMKFTDKPAEVVFAKTLQGNDIFWEVKASGLIDGEEVSAKRICNYASIDENQKNHHKKIDFTLNMGMIYELSILKGTEIYQFQPFGSNRQYNGKDLIDDFAQKAFTSLGDQIPAGATFNRARIKFMHNGAEVPEIITPALYDKIDIVSTDNEKFSYVDSDYRFVIGKTSFDNVTVTLASVQNPSVSSNWEHSVNIPVNIANAVANAIDGVEYKIKGEQTFTKAIGSSFEYKTDSKDSNGTVLVVRGLKGDAIVTKEIEVIVKIDNKNPTINFDDSKLTEKWLNTDVTVEFGADGGVSGIKSVMINGTSAQATTQNNFKFTFTGNLEYTIVVTDGAGNVAEHKVTAKIDKTAPTIDGLRYFTKDGDKEVAYVSGTKIAKTVYATFNATLGQAGGYVEYYPTNNISEKKTVACVNGKVDMPIVKSTEKGDTYTFVLYSNAVNPVDDARFSVNKVDTTVVIVTQATLRIEKNQITITKFEKEYDGTTDFDAGVSVNITEPDYQGKVRAVGTLSQKDAGTGLTLTITLLPIEGFNFVIDSSDGHNDYVFTEFGGNKFAINKKVVTVTINGTTKVYGSDNPEFTANVVGVVAGETLNYKLTTTANKTSDVGNYDIVADETVDYGNYAPNFVNGTLSITKFDIKNAVIENFKDAYADDEIPAFKAAFTTPFGTTSYLVPTFYFEGKPYTFKESGNKHGKYNYNLTCAPSEVMNYNVSVDPMVLQGFILVVQDMVDPNVDYKIKGEENGVIKVAFTNEYININDLITFNDAMLQNELKIFYGTEENIQSNIKDRGEYIITLKVENSEHFGAFTKEYTVNVVKAKVDVVLNSIEKVFDNQNTSVDIDEATKATLAKLGVSQDQVVITGNNVKNVGTHNVDLTIDNPNLELITASTTITITKASIAPTFTDVKKEYNGEPVVIALSKEDNAALQALGVTENNIVYSNNNIVDAGEYNVTITIKNDNINTFTTAINVIITAIEIPEEVSFGEMTDELEEMMDNMVYTGKPYDIIKLPQDVVDMLTSKGYSIKYTCNGVETDTVTDAGEYKICAIISKQNYKDKEVVMNFTGKPDKVTTLVVQKASLQEKVDTLYTQKDLKIPVPREYNGKLMYYTLPQEISAKLAAEGISISFADTVHKFVDAGSYEIIYRCNYNNNYEQAEISVEIEILPMTVDIKYEQDKESYKEGDTIKLRAYYIDIDGNKVYVKYDIEEIYMEDGEENTKGANKEELKGGKYLITSSISDENYAISEKTETYRLEIKNKFNVGRFFAYSGGTIAGLALLIVACYFIFDKTPKLSSQVIDVE